LESLTALVSCQHHGNHMQWIQSLLYKGIEGPCNSFSKLVLLKLYNRIHAHTEAWLCTNMHGRATDPNALTVHLYTKSSTCCFGGALRAQRKKADSIVSARWKGLALMANICWCFA